MFKHNGTVEQLQVTEKIVLQPRPIPAPRADAAAAAATAHILLCERSSSSRSTRRITLLLAVRGSERRGSTRCTCAAMAAGSWQKVEGGIPCNCHARNCNTRNCRARAGTSPGPPPTHLKQRVEAAADGRLAAPLQLRNCC